MYKSMQASMCNIDSYKLTDELYAPYMDAANVRPYDIGKLQEPVPARAAKSALYNVFGILIILKDIGFCTFYPSAYFPKVIFFMKLAYYGRPELIVHSSFKQERYAFTNLFHHVRSSSGSKHILTG